MPPVAANNREKVAILGGGVGAMAAAFELTAPELDNRFEVTVYQLGWRLGGKGASGRNADHGNRIEEHGLHVWFGFYDNAFRMMRAAYNELNRPSDKPLATLEDAFKGCDEIVLYDRQGTGWHDFGFYWPPNLDKPGDPLGLPTFWDMASKMSRWALYRWRTIHGERPDLHLAGTHHGFIPDFFDDLVNAVDAGFERVVHAGAEPLLRLADLLSRQRAAVTDPADPTHVQHHAQFAQLLTGFRDWLWEHVVKDRYEDDPNLRLFFTLFDTFASITAGIVEDGVLDKGFDAVNDREWCEWLATHGAKEVTLGATPAERSPVLRSVYDVAFGYVDGRIEKANVAAGTATHDLLRLLFAYRGSLFYKMQAGMGDTVFGPLYEVLHERGVCFRFFHAVTKLGLSDDGKRIDSIEVVPQVEVKGSEYDPLVTVEDLPCWPSEPKWDQLADGEVHRANGVDFERELNPLDKKAETIPRGDKGFHHAVLGIPVGALGEICDQLIKQDPRFRKMMDSSVTVPTQAFQLWMKEGSEDLGWRHGRNSVAGCYVEPLDTYCDMDHLVARESWNGAVQGIAYFCGVLDDQAETPDQADARAEANMQRFLDHDVGPIWPTAIEQPPGSALRDDLVVQKYSRANVTASERYVLTPAVKVMDRLPSDDSGFENLVLAGDWTKNGLDGGCVEAAVVSGMQAARKLTGVDKEIIGEDTKWLSPS